MILNYEARDVKKNCYFLKISILIFLLFYSVIGSSCASSEVPLIPMKDFFRNPQKIGFSLSPDGTHFAFLQSWEDRLNIFTQKIGEEKEIRITESTERDIAGYLWANDQRIVMRRMMQVMKFLTYAVDIDGSDEKS